MSHVWRLCQRQIFEVMSYQEKKSLSNLIVRKSGNPDTTLQITRIVEIGS